MRKSGIRALSGMALLWGASVTYGSEWTRVSDKYLPELSPEISAAAVTVSKSAVIPDQVVAEIVAQKTEGLQKYQKDAELRLEFVRHSLLGSHFYYRQFVGDIPTEEGQYIVSVRKGTGEVYQTFDRTVTQEMSLSEEKFAGISEEESLTIAWDYIKGRGQLLEKPAAKKVLFRSKAGLTPGYMVRLSVSEPFGYWNVLVDAGSGEIVKSRDERITRNPVPTLEELNKVYQGKATDFQKARQNFSKKQAKDDSRSDKNQGSGDGSALVFDPDPRTTLNDGSLSNDSAAALFEDAYFEKVLKDLTIAGGVYTLKGPWVTILDFESPSIAPSTSQDGTWSFRRNNVAFHDTMTYFHLDQNQRYIQSLGFLGQTGIQYGSIETDANGLGGADNSHFIPSSNRVAFGHGCVPDNEDADVILHEYGHAIHHSVNPGWGGGDSGAMGEGFGDYWAASHSISTPNGKVFQPYQVFSWDGPDCWPGRRLDKLNARYDHGTNYGAHVGMGDFVSDELWSTPLFQALWELVEDGYPRENVDRIILQAHFGLGSGMKMRGMAEAIVRTATELYPDGPYAGVFQRKFSHHNILELPRADFELTGVSFTGAGANHAPDPGESIGLVFKIKNPGNHEARGIRGVLISRNPNVVVERAAVSFPDIRAGGESEAESAFQVTLSQAMSCGEAFGLTLRLQYEGGASSEKELLTDIPTGVADVLSQQETLSPPLPVPDNDSSGLLSIMRVSEAGEINASMGLEVSINLEHTYTGDLKVSLKSPSGKSVLLHNRSGGSQDNLTGTWPTTLSPAESLDVMNGESLQGSWELFIQDLAARDTGNLKNWGLKAVRSVTCERQPLS